MSNESIGELKELDGQRKTLELSAQQHEQAARDDRAKMSEAKLRAAELRAIINDSAVVESVQSSLALAKSAQASVEASQAAIEKMVEPLKERETQLDTKLKQVDALLADLTDVGSDAVGGAETANIDAAAVKSVAGK